MADEDTLAELTELFSASSAKGRDKPLDSDVVLELTSIMRIHGLSAQDMFYKWESYCIKMDQTEMKLSMKTARAFKQDLQDALERSVRFHVAGVSGAAAVKSERKKGVGATPRASAAAKGADVFGILDGLVPNTPGTGKLSKKHQTPHSLSRVRNAEATSSPIASHLKSASTPSKLSTTADDNAAPATSFADRPNHGETIEVLNSHIPLPEPPICPFDTPRIALRGATERKKLGYKNLVMKLSATSGVLNDRIDDYEHLIKHHHNLEDSAFDSAASRSNSEIIAVGRIASDSTDGTGRLNLASMVLEMSRDRGNALRAPLDLSRLRGNHSFFPGQIVAARGSNPSGEKFIVTEILASPLLPSAASTRGELAEVRQRLRGDPMADDEDDDPPIPLNILIASGPYTADDNLDFQPLYALVDEAEKINADGVILCGPFIDIDHPLIATGDFDLPEEALEAAIAANAADPDAAVATMEMVFKYLISPALNRLVKENASITIILVPHVRDAVDKSVSWPQEEFPKKGLGLPKQVRVVGNPMMVHMNEMVVGVSSQDVLSEMRGEEVFVRGAPSVARGHEKVGGVGNMDMLARLSRGLVEQRHYFPLFPPANRHNPKIMGRTGLGNSPTGAVLDSGYLKLGEMVTVRPDVLVLPSAMPAFVKVVESVLVINPGPLSKRRGAGTYAKMSLLAPGKLGGEDPGENVGHGIFDRARVEVVRI